MIDKIIGLWIPSDTITDEVDYDPHSIPNNVINEAIEFNERDHLAEYQYERVTQKPVDAFFKKGR